MGRVTEREAGRAADIARGVGGGSHFGRRTGAGAGDADDAAGETGR